VLRVVTRHRRAAAGEPGAACGHARRHGTVWLVAVLAAAGCAGRGPRVARPSTAVELLDALAARRAAVTTLRARAHLKSGVSGLWVREAVVVRRPDEIRIDVLSPFGLALAIGVAGDRLWAYPPARATRYEGDASPENLVRFLGAPVAVPDVVDLLLGVPPARAPAAPPVVSTTPDGEYRVTVPLASGTQTLWFAGHGGLVRRAEETRDDRAVLRVAFDDYREGFPRVVDVSSEDGPSARLVYDTVEPNAPVDPAVFAPPPAPRVLPIEAAPAEETS
jgi:hypothetical protein